MSNFRPVDRDTGFLMPPSVDEWLPEKHLARFVVDVIASLDRRRSVATSRGLKPPAYQPRLPQPTRLAPSEHYLRERVTAFPELSGRRLLREIASGATLASTPQ